MKMIRIYLAEDHAMIRKALSGMIKLFPLRCDVREAENGKQLLDMVEQYIPDIVIIDMDMPMKSGYNTVKRLKQNYPEVKVIGFSLFYSPADVDRAISSGTDALITQNMMPDEFSQMISSLAGQDGAYNPAPSYINKNAGPSSDHGHRDTFKVELTEREQAVVDLICKEFTNKQIGYALKLSENTVRNHKVRIMRRAGAKNTPGLVKLALQDVFFLRRS